MRLFFLALLYCLQPELICAQSVPQRIQLALNKLQTDSQFRHAITAITVADLQTGKIVFERNSQLALAPASTQKIITSIAAFEVLGAAFRYETIISYDGNIKDSVLAGNIYVLGSGDPTLGSNRWKYTNEREVMDKIVAAIKKTGIKKIIGEIICGNNSFSAQAIPGGWPWEDIGSYYGAGAYAVNWRENIYEVELSSGGEIGKKVTVVGPGEGQFSRIHFTNELMTDKKGTGDNAYIYPSLDAMALPVLRGTIPVNEKSFMISGAYLNPPYIFKQYLTGWLTERGVEMSTPDSGLSSDRSGVDFLNREVKKGKAITTLQSPPLDSLNYYFLRNSINLYGEAFVKTICLQKTGFAATDRGMEWIRDFWQQKGIEKTALTILDGSGLSPQNRVTTGALVKALQYAKKQPWFAAFLDGLPEYNGMKLKSGSIGGVRAYAGYHKTPGGKEYAVSIIVNGYNGSGSPVTKKLFMVLDALK
jgi:serine-type D-Ala-D-Ala carboxypeptidase/endopeptidase (penicillin-binding protein 4)